MTTGSAAVQFGDRRWTSTGVMDIVRGDGTPVKAGNSITLGSLNCWPKW